MALPLFLLLALLLQDSTYQMDYLKPVLPILYNLFYKLVQKDFALEQKNIPLAKTKDRKKARLKKSVVFCPKSFFSAKLTILWLKNKINARPSSH